MVGLESNVATAIEASTPPPGFSAKLVALISMLLGSGKGGLQLDARTRTGIGHARPFIERVEPPFLPSEVANLLSEDVHWLIRVQPAVTRVGGDLVRLPCVCAHWRLTTEFVKRTQAVPSSESERVCRALNQFRLPPSALTAGQQLL